MARLPCPFYRDRYDDDDDGDDRERQGLARATAGVDWCACGGRLLLALACAALLGVLAFGACRYYLDPPPRDQQPVPSLVLPTTAPATQPFRQEDPRTAGAIETTATTTSTVRSPSR